MTSSPTPGLASRIDAITRFLPDLEVPGAAGAWDGGQKNADGSITMPWFEFSETALAFKRACAANGWVDPTFRWPDWQTDAQRYIDHPELIASLDVESLQRLLTTHVRSDRFNEGHLASAIESGHISAILRRLQVIRAELPT